MTLKNRNKKDLKAEVNGYISFYHADYNFLFELYPGLLKEINNPITP